MKRIATACLAALSLAATAQTPPPAQSSIYDKAVNKPGIAWQLYGADQSAKEVPAADVPGGNAVRVQVSRAGAHAWDIGAAYPTVKLIAAGETILVMVFLRAPNAKEGEETSLPIGASEADAPYTPIADETVKIGSAWRRYFAHGVAPKAFAPGKARVAIQLAGAKQVVEIGPAFLLDMGPGFDAAKLPHN